MKQYYYPEGRKTELMYIGKNDMYMLYQNHSKTKMYIYTIDGQYVNDCMYRDIADIRYYDFPDSLAECFK